MQSHYARYYAFVHPLFWPWLWFQLVRINCWQRIHKRDLLLAVDRRGNIRVRAIADAPAPANQYRYTPPAVPAWERPALGSDVPVEFLNNVSPAPRAKAANGSGLTHIFASTAPLYLNFDTS